MTARRTLLFWLAILFTPLPAFAATPVIGQPAPDFRFKTFDGQKVSLSDLHGSVVILNLWATWCGPCKRELPLLDGYYKARKDVGLVVLALDLDDEISDMQLNRLQKALAIPMLRSMHGPYEAIGGAVPTNFIIDRAGVLRYAKAAAFDIDTLNAVLVPLLNERPPPRPSPTDQPPLTQAH